MMSKKGNLLRPTGQRNITSPEHFVIVTNTEKTEKNYFEGLIHSLPGYPKNISIEVYSGVDLLKLVPQAENLSAKFNPNNIWIVFDYDQDKNFDGIIKKAEAKKIPVAWSNPCFEVWLLAYFENIPSDIGDSQICTKKFEEVFKKKTNLDYKKSDKKIYDYLKKFGDGEDKAFERAKNVREPYEEMTQADKNESTSSLPKNKKMTPSRMVPSTKVDLLVKKILKKEETQSAMDVSS